MREAWGKCDKKTGAYHPLAHHSMDVAAVFACLLALPVVRNRAETAAGRPLDETDCQRLAALVFLHDIGKLHPGFQAKGWPPDLWTKPTCGHQIEGCEFLTVAYRDPSHPFHESMLKMTSWGDEAAEAIIAGAFAHHGRPVDWPNDPTMRLWSRLPHYDWQRDAAVLSRAMRDWFPRAFTDGSALPNKRRFHHLVAGFAALADWIGSNTALFPFRQPFDSTYNAVAAAAAKRALAELGLDPSALANVGEVAFRDLTGGLSPNAAQLAVADIDMDARLVILEAETGSGKTEAALWRYTKLLAAGKVSGLYFAVPTRAAARQLHRRVHHAIRRAYGSHAPEAVLAVPGLLRSGDFAGQRLPGWKVLWDDQKPILQLDEQGGVLNRWAAEHATRFLAASVAVGTVDQAMLSALQVKHAHMRGSALSRSLLVVDEVHASDAYMTQILRRLTDEHLAIGGYAMLMSATLGSTARVGWTGESPPTPRTAAEAPYPAVWVAGTSAPRAVSESGRPKRVRLITEATMEPTRAAALALDAARRGARVLVVRNTVTMAIDTWEAAREADEASLLMQAGGGPALHHSRFAMEDRRLLDAEVETVLAKDRAPGAGGCIVIGTQTLEQSLDIDADLLISDLCPIDVLLQRIGRLHRHPLARPDGFEQARAVVLLPEGGLDRLAAPAFNNGLGAWERDGTLAGVYLDLAGLELTKDLINRHGEWRIPEMNRELVEGGTHPELIDRLLETKGHRWQRYHQKLSGTDAAARSVAGLSVLDRDMPFDTELRFPKSDEHVLTRLSEEGVVLDLESQPFGPFGTPISRLTLPARWCRGVSSEAEVDVREAESGLEVTVAGERLSYTRSGLKRC